MTQHTDHPQVDVVSGPGWGPPPPHAWQPPRPAQPWYPPGHQPFRDSRTLGVWSIVTAVILAGCYVLASTGIVLYTTSQRDSNLELVGVIVFGLATMAKVGCALPAWIVTASWLRRAQENVLRLPGAVLLGPRRGGWCFGVWVIPVLAWWLPYRLVQNLRSASCENPRAGVLGAWWVAWLVTSLGEVALVAFNLVDRGHHGDEAVPACVEVVVGVAAVAGAALWARIVQDVVRGQAHDARTLHPVPPLS